MKVRDDDEEAKEPASAISEVSIKPQKIETLAQIIAASSPVEKKSISKPPSPAHSRVTSKNETDDILSKIESVVASIPRAQPRSANANRRGRASKSSTAEDARGKISSKTGDSGMVARSGRNNTTSDGADSASKHKPSNSIPQSQAAKKPAQPNTR